MTKMFALFFIIVLAVTEDVDFDRSLVQLIQDAGRTVEVHKVHTEDHYTLTVFRLPSKLKNPRLVLMMHGLESSAADYVIGGNNASLAYLLSDNGYDVWLGNARGNIFSRNHKTLTVDSHEFWKFSWHEIGVYDLPAIIDYALDMDRATSLTYCGYSQGTTVYFVLLSMRPEYNSKISSAFLMAPAAYMRFPSQILIPLASNSDQITNSLIASRQYDLFPPSQTMRKMLANFCNKRMAGLTACKANYMMVGGDTRSQYNEDLMPQIFQFFPAAAGYRQLLHYAQIVNNNGTLCTIRSLQHLLYLKEQNLGIFVRFDHKKRKNLELYGQLKPPAYNLSNIQTKMHFLYGLSDILTNPKDVQFLIRKLKAFTTGITEINDWNHLDFVFGKDIHEKVNNVIVQKMKST